MDRGTRTKTRKDINADWSRWGVVLSKSAPALQFLIIPCGRSTPLFLSTWLFLFLLDYLWSSTWLSLIMPLITLAHWSSQVWIELIFTEDQLLTKMIQVLILKAVAFHKSVCVKRAWSFLIDPTFTNDELRLIYDGCWSVLLITICHYLTKGAPRKAARADSSFFNLSLYNSPTGQGITWSSQRFWRLWWWQPS